MRRAVPAIVVALGLVVPAAASAQSAGDNQYVDPFAGSQPPAKHHPQQAQGTSQPAGGASPSAPVSSVQPSSATGTSSTTASSSQLPRTGQPLTPLFALGGALLLTGLVLRLKLRRPRTSNGPQLIDLRPYR